MSTITDCPSCKRKLRVPDELLGHEVRCPTCNETFALVADQADESTAAPSDAAPTGELDDQPASPPNTENCESKQESSLPESGEEKAPAAEISPCPYCGELIPKSAGRCRYCGESLGEDREEEDEGEDDEFDDRPWEREFRPYRGVRRDSEPHRGNLILILGIVSIVVPAVMWPLSFISLGLGIAAWVMGRRDMKKMRANLMDPQGFGTTQAGFICGIVGTCLSSICGIGCLAYLGFVGFIVTSASRMTPPSTPAPAPIPKKAPANPGKNEAAPVVDQLLQFGGCPKLVGQTLLSGGQTEVV
jgi:predicted Zn finger-like uncharacterized protein